MENRNIMDIFAYYLSEFDRRAFSVLGYETQTKGFEELAGLYGKKESYLRRLRDEYDVVTNSTRRGQCNRPPRERIIKTAEHLKQFQFDELTEMILTFCKNKNHPYEEYDELTQDALSEAISEIDIENILNFKDSDATVRIRTSNQKVRVYNTSIIAQLKKLYDGRCQVCGKRAFEEYNVDLCEAHHIDYFSSSHNNDASNIIILCPNHHRLIHKLNPSFDYLENEYGFSDGTKLKIKLNVHLSIKE